MAFVLLSCEQTTGVCEAVSPASKRRGCWRRTAVRFWRTAVLDFPMGQGRRKKRLRWSQTAHFGGPGTCETASGATRAVTARSSFTAAVAGFQQRQELEYEGCCSKLLANDVLLSASTFHETLQSGLSISPPGCVQYLCRHEAVRCYPLPRSCVSVCCIRFCPRL